MFRIVVKGEFGDGKIGGIESVGLSDEGASLIAPYNDIKSSLLAMVSLEYVVERNIPPITVPLRGKV